MPSQYTYDLVRDNSKVGNGWKHMSLQRTKAKRGESPPEKQVKEVQKEPKIPVRRMSVPERTLSSSKSQVNQPIINNINVTVNVDGRHSMKRGRGRDEPLTQSNIDSTPPAPTTVPTRPRSSSLPSETRSASPATPKPASRSRRTKAPLPREVAALIPDVAKVEQELAEWKRIIDGFLQGAAPPTAQALVWGRGTLCSGFEAAIVDRLEELKQNPALSQSGSGEVKKQINRLLRRAQEELNRIALGYEIQGDEQKRYQMLERRATLKESSGKSSDSSLQQDMQETRKKLDRLGIDNKIRASDRPPTYDESTSWN